ncbi:MAG TPA: response regulator [Chitinophagaceae bacterium]|nr:response regulator [Chitinophagaceae bacterium]
MNICHKLILCVDDDEDDLSMLREALNREGDTYHIIVAFDGVHALELLQQIKQSHQQLPCLVILDINMPRMDGRETLSALQRDSELSTIPVVLYSTSSSVSDVSFSTTNKVKLIKKPATVTGIHMAASQMLEYCKA